MVLKKNQWDRLVSSKQKPLHLDISNSNENIKTPDRLIIVDPAFVNLLGHSSGYALFSARNFGAHLVLSNKQANETTNPKLTIVKTFSEDIWGKSNKRSSYFLVINRCFQVASIRINQIKNFSRSVFWGIKNNCFCRYFCCVFLRLPPSIFRKLFLPSAGFRNILVVLHRVLVVFRNFLFSMLLLLIPEVVLVFFRGFKIWIKELAPLERLPSYLSVVFNARNFRYLLEARVGLKKGKLRNGDLVFFHMITYNNIIGTVALVEKIFKITNIPPVMFWRYPCNLTLLAKNWGFSLALRKLEYYVEKGMLRMASDSHLLIEKYGAVTCAPFELFPIPHGKTLLTKTVSDRLCVATLGNARAEKGFVEICNVLDLVNNSTIRDNVRFLIQCNDPDLLSRPLIDQIKRKNYLFPIHFIDRAITDIEYNHYLNEADVVLVPYHQEIYNSRTSGVALESMALGKIVITTENTWMSDQVDLFGAGIVIKDKSASSLFNAIKRAVVEYSHLSIQATESAIKVAQVHSSMNFYHCLVGSHRIRVHKHRQVAFHYPWEDLFEFKGGSSLRSSLFIRALSEKGWHINVCARLNSTLVSQIPKNVTLYKIEEPTTSFAINDFYFFNFTLRFFSKPWLIGGEEFQYLFKYWCRKHSTKLMLNAAVRQSEAVILEYPFVTELFRCWTEAYNIPLVVDNLDVLANQFTYKKIKNKILRSELTGMSDVDLAISVTAADREFFTYHGVDTITIRQPIDLQNSKHLNASLAIRILAEEGIVLPEKFGLFIGSNFGPNLSAAKSLLKLSRNSLLIQEHISLVTAGKCQLGIKEKNGHFIELGAVSKEALQALYSLAAFVIIPLTKGTGASLKTVEAFAYQKIVIGTDIAFRGLDVAHGTHCLISNDLDKMPELIVNALKNQPLITTLKSAAFRLVEKQHYSTVFDPVINLLNRKSLHCRGHSIVSAPERKPFTLCKVYTQKS